MMKAQLIPLVSFLALVGGLFAAPADPAPITELKDLRAKKAVFKEATEKKPLVLRSLKDGAKYFEKESLSTISKAVDFEKQTLFLFAWHGSGQDRLHYVTKKSKPEQILFLYEVGETEDLRPHVKIFVLRSDVKWAVK